MNLEYLEADRTEKVGVCIKAVSPLRNRVKLRDTLRFLIGFAN